MMQDLLANEILMSLVTSGAGLHRLNETQLIDIASGTGDYGMNLLNLLSNSFDTTDVSRPHSYMIWMLYDNNMRLIPEGSGAKCVSNPNELGTLIEQDIPALTDGYLHCEACPELVSWVSNSAVQPVSYDNFLASYLRGQTRQINHYYPYGLSIDGLSRSDEYLNKYTSKELQTGEFDLMVSSGLEMFDFHARFYDPALGRWFTPDPAEQFANPYLAMANNPVRYTDPNGMYTGIYDYDEDGGGGGGDGGGIIEFEWDVYTGPAGSGGWSSQMNYGANNGSYLMSNSSWLNDYGAHNGSFAPYAYNGHIYTYDASRGVFGYEKEYVGVFGTAIQWAYFPNNPEAKVIYKPLFGVVNEWVSGEAQGGGGDFSNSQLALGTGGLLYGVGENVLAPGSSWLGNNGKYYNKSWGGNQWTGSRAGALKSSGLFKVAGKLTFGAGALISGYQGYNHLMDGNYSGAAKSGLDIGMGYVSTLGVPGLIIGGGYFLIDATLGWKSENAGQHGNRLMINQSTYGFGVMGGK